LQVVGTWQGPDANLSILAVPGSRHTVYVTMTNSSGQVIASGYASLVSGGMVASLVDHCGQPFQLNLAFDAQTDSLKVQSSPTQTNQLEDTWFQRAP
jgi:hypothetical protein